ncbi:hypothetical protein BD309DRAFT_867606 [Dichomitus squalens]|nr:hypothetical protein BD309DRAFT_867606 [Dichomitus squalens]
MATAFPTVSTFATKVAELTDTATHLRRALLNNQPKIRQIDFVLGAVSSSSFLQEWETCAEDYHGILESSEGAAIKLAATIEYYLSLLDETNDPAEIEDTIEELKGFRQASQNSAMNSKLPQIRFEHTAQWDALVIRLGNLAGTVTNAVATVGPQLQNDVNVKESRISSLEKELQMYRKREESEATLAQAQSFVADAWGTVGKSNSGWQYDTRARNADAKRQTRASYTERPETQQCSRQEEARIDGELTRERASLKQAVVTLREHEELDLKRIISVIVEIQMRLTTQSGLLRDVFSDVTCKLTNDSKNYLSALLKVHGNPTPSNQLDCRNAKQRAMSSSVVWQKRAQNLVDGYAKRMK